MAKKACENHTVYSMAKSLNVQRDTFKRKLAKIVVYADINEKCQMCILEKAQECLTPKKRNLELNSPKSESKRNKVSIFEGSKRQRLNKTENILNEMKNLAESENTNFLKILCEIGKRYYYSPKEGNNRPMALIFKGS